MTNENTLWLVDGSSYLYRAFHALPSLSNGAGEPTGALYGVINMLRKLMEDSRPTFMAVIFDAPGKTFRDDLFDAYKANRPPMPDELAQQTEPLRAMVQAMGLPLLQVAGVEADDVIGTLATRAATQGMRVVISTGDKDMAQLVNDRITLLDTMKNSATDAAGVEKKYGVPPERIIDYLALMGDSSDNIPGVPGVGPKTAAKWLQEHGSLDNLIDRADAIQGKVGEKLRSHLDQLSLSRQLATIRRDVALDRTPDQLRCDAPDRDALRQLYRRFEFKGWLRQLDEDAPEPEQSTVASPQDQDYQIVQNPAQLMTWLEKLATAELFAFDTETTGLDYMEARIVGVSFATDVHQAAYVPLTHDYPGAPDQLDRDTVLEQLRPLLEDPRRAKLGQNLKYDLHILSNHGIHLRGIAHDTMLESYVLDSTGARHDMDSLAERYLGVQTIHYEDVAGKGAKQLSFNQVPLEQAGPYAAEDADITLRLHRRLWPDLQQTASLKVLYEQLEIPLVTVLARIEHTGVQVDAEALRRQSQELANRLMTLEREAHEQAGQPFNLASPKQLQHILFEKQGLPVRKKTPKGQPSTAEDVLQELALDFPLPKLILEHRSLNKLKSTYTDKLPLQVNARTGRVHTSYHQAVASTGRLSSSDPNLQNIPIRTPEGRRIRQAFVAPYWLPHPGGGLFADRAADHGPPVRGRGSAAGLPRR